MRSTLTRNLSIGLALVAAIPVAQGLVVSGGSRVVMTLVLAAVALFLIQADLVERSRIEQALRDSEARFRAAADASLDAFYVLRAVRCAGGDVIDFEFVDANARTESLLGRPRARIVGERLCELIPAIRTGGRFARYVRVMESGSILEEEREISSPEVRTAWVRQQVVPLPDGVAITSRDMTEQKQQEHVLRSLSLIDDLTELYNRRGFLALAQQQLKVARRGHRELLLLFVDMDDFKDINDRYGHAEGDRALQRAADVLRRTFRDSDIIARIGGDEFVVLASDSGASTSAVVVNRLRDEIAVRNERDGYPYRLSFSVGVARFDPLLPPSIEELLATADRMLLEQKGHRREAARVPA